MDSKIYDVSTNPAAAVDIVGVKNTACYRILSRLRECTRSHRVFLLVSFVPDICKVLVLCFLGHVNGTPEAQVIICFLEVLAPRSEQLRIRRYHDAVQPTRKKKQERNTDVSREEGLKDPECVRLKYISKKAKGQGESSCNLSIRALALAPKS